MHQTFLQRAGGWCEPVRVCNFRSRASRQATVVPLRLKVKKQGGTAGNILSPLEGERILLLQGKIFLRR
ncbi:hypothetical protein ATZ99_04030 [Thermovenabulum gondwanense]|uniref:Uncharacterized protein n=1 Tax=Thermovenabulum gondwanense TaxID=520767 RepID=A0A162MY01_9FIRM|nr:hypothetical protein ATZ99_04030 [Thermovenabulum gondwanense]